MTTRGWPHGGGEVGALIRARDWSVTEFGSIDTWPASLRVVVDLVLGCDLPMSVLWGPSLNQIYNDRFRRLMGDRHPAGLGQPVRECWTAAERRSDEIYARILGGESMTFRDRMFPIAWDGEVEERWFSSTYTPVRDEGGRVQGALVTIIETSERVRSEARRAEAERRLLDALHTAGVTEEFRKLFEAAPTPLIALDAGMRVIAANDAYLTMVRAERAALVGRTIFDVLPTEADPDSPDGEEARAALRHLLSTRGDGAVAVQKYAVPREPGSNQVEERWWALATTPVLGQAGSVSLLLLRVEDLTETMALRSVNDVQMGELRHQHTLVDTLRAAETGLRDHAARQALSLELGDALSPLTDPRDVTEAACRLLAHRLNADHVYFLQIDETAGRAVVEGDFARDGDVLAGRHDVAALDVWPHIVRRRPFTVIGHAVHADVPHPPSGARSGSRACMGAPLVRNGVLVGALCVTAQAPRLWSTRETAFLAEAADRLWTALERARSEKALRRSEARSLKAQARLRALVEGIPQLIWRAVGEGRWTWASPQWIAYTGQSAAASLDAGWLDMIHPDDRERVRAAWAQAMTTQIFDVEYRVFNSAQQRHRWCQTRAAPVRTRGGRVLEWLGTSTDIDELRRLQDEQGLLMAELQHRSRNLVAVVRSTAARTLPPGRSLDEFVGRLTALSRVQGVLARSDGHAVDWGDIVRSEIAAHSNGHRVHIKGESLRLPGATAQPLALALHELATNAVKYGALSTARGKLEVSWRTTGSPGPDRALEVEWIESGVDIAAPADEPVRPRGYGLELIEQALPYQLGAATELVFAPGGVRCRIRVTLAQSDADAATG